MALGHSPTERKALGHSPTKRMTWGILPLREWLWGILLDIPFNTFEYLPYLHYPQFSAPLPTSGPQLVVPNLWSPTGGPQVVVLNSWLPTHVPQTWSPTGGPQLVVPNFWDHELGTLYTSQHLSTTHNTSKTSQHNATSPISFQ